MGDRIDLDYTGLTRAIKELSERVEGVDTILPDVAQLLVGAVADEFETEGHGRWPEFAPATLRGRRGQGNPKLLEDTGVLLGSIHAETGTDWAEASTNVPYAKYHVMGWGVPPRDPFDLAEPEVLLSDVESLIYDHLEL